MITGSLGNTAVLTCTGKLDAAGFRMFHPLPFMHATPAGRLTAVNLPEYIAEEKFDGLRCQIHISGGDAVLFSRDHNDISSSFPDIISIFTGKKMPDTVMDGVLCIFRDKTIQPFGQLQKRINLKKPSAEVLEQHPVIFIAFDVMYTAGRVVFELPLVQRRLLLEQISEEHGIFITRQYEIGSREDADRLFSEARARGNDGLMLKKQGSPYEFGQRNKSWLKVIKPGGSIDAVIMYATAGSGKRGGTCTEFTMGVSVKDDERYEEEFIPIGKISGGFSVDELEKLNSAIKPLIADRFGPTLSLLPGIMAEIEFDNIQVNKRTKAGYTLRHPRLTDIRPDPGPADAATLRDVEELYETLANTVRLPQGENASFICCRE
jgi:DNA ligase 1